MVVGCYVGFGLNTGEDCKSWSHMCGSWYLPMLQFEGGSCMWINIASLMVLDWLWISLCIMLNWLGSSGRPVVALWMCIWEGPFKCSLTLSPKDLPGLPNV